MIRGLHTRRELRESKLVRCAHGFQVRSDVADVTYKVDAYHAPDIQTAIAWDAPDIGITWPLDDPILSGPRPPRRDLARVGPARRAVLDEPALGVHGRGARGHGRRRALVGGGLQVLAAVRAVGLQPIVAAARGDRDAYRAVEEPRSRGYAGARCVHPTEVSTATKVFAATA